MISMRNILFPYLFILFIGIQGTVLGNPLLLPSPVTIQRFVWAIPLAAYIYFSGGEGPWDVVINDPNGENHCPGRYNVSTYSLVETRIQQYLLHCLCSG